MEAPWKRSVSNPGARLVASLVLAAGQTGYVVIVGPRSRGLQRGDVWMRSVAARQGTLRRVLSTRIRGGAVVVATLAAAAVLPPAAVSAATGSACPGGRDGPGWTLSTNTFDQNFSHHAYVGN